MIHTRRSPLELVAPRVEGLFLLEDAVPALGDGHVLLLLISVFEVLHEGALVDGALVPLPRALLALRLLAAQVRLLLPAVRV